MQSMNRIGLATGTLTDAEVAYIEQTIVGTMRPMLVGRTLMPTRPLANAGFKNYTFYTENDMSAAQISMTGEEQNMDRVDLTEHNVKIPIISKDYTLHWRDVLMRRNNGQDLNTQNAANAARQVAEDEDRMILSGESLTTYAWPCLGIEGLLSATGRNTTGGGDWSNTTNMFTYTTAALVELQTDGFFGPYKLLLTPTFYAQTLVPYSTTDRLYIQILGDLIGGMQNIVVSGNLYAHDDGAADSAAVVDVSPGNFELVVGQDASTYLAQLPNMNYQGKVWEAVVPVIKRPQAICEITSLT
jgi:uncharacterized linocin/CFP29 family protein